MTYCLINTSRRFYFWEASLITCGVLKQNLFFSLKRTFFSKDRLWHLLKNMSSMKHCPWRQESALCLQSLDTKNQNSHRISEWSFLFHNYHLALLLYILLKSGSSTDNKTSTNYFSNIKLYHVNMPPTVFALVSSNRFACILTVFCRYLEWRRG